MKSFQWGKRGRGRKNFI